MEFSDFGIRVYHIILSNGELKIDLNEIIKFLAVRYWSNGIVEMEWYTRRLLRNDVGFSLKGWHHVLYHMKPGAIQHLEKQGLIQSSDSTVASDMKY